MQILKRKNKQIYLLHLFVGLIMTGCQTIPYQGVAREVKKKPNDSGLIAMPINPRSEDRNLAETKMKTNCIDGKFRIIEEGEFVTGQATTTDSSTSNRDRNKQQVGSLFGIPVTSGDSGGTDSTSSSRTEQLKEWQVSYECLTKSKIK
jgi:hypothetical protein